MKSNYWKGIYEILKKSTTGLNCKKIENDRYRMAFTFNGKGFVFEETNYSSFDLRTQKKDYIACKVFNSVKSWGTAENWSGGKPHSLQKEAFELYMLCLTANEREEYKKRAEIEELEKTLYSVKDTIQQKQQEILKLNPELYNEFSKKSKQAINLIEEAVKLMRDFEHYGNKITHTGCHVQIGYEWIEDISKRREELGLKASS